MADGVVLREISVSTIAIVSASAANLLLVWRIFSGAPKWVEQWIALRRAKAEEKASDWKQLRDLASDLREEITRLSLRVKHLEDKLQESEAARLDALTRAVTAEAIIQGHGIAAQHVQVAVSTDRMKKDKP